jgi:glycosyltransferase involved in cell wall biosynthesis
MQRLEQGLLRAGHEPVLQWFPHWLQYAPWILKRVVAPSGTQIIHASSWQAFAYRRKGIPLVVTEHHYIGHPAFAAHRTRAQRLFHEHFVRRCVARSYTCADALVGVSHTTADAIKRDFDRDVSVVHNWVDTDLFSPLQRPAKCERPFRLLFVGNPSRWKGSDLLVELATGLGAAFEVRCLGGLRNTLSLPNRPANVNLLARTEPQRMPEVYRDADAALVLARYEAFGYVALEAMACGLPVAGFDTTGTAEVCVNGETALLSPIDDLNALIANVRRLEGDRQLCTILGEAGRERAVAMFSEAAAIRRYIEIYEEVWCVA